MAILGGGAAIEATLAGLDSGFEDSEISIVGFRLPLTTLPTVDTVLLPFVPVAFAFLNSRRSFVSGSRLVAAASRLLEGRIPLIEFNSLTLLRGGAAVGSAGGILACC